VGLAYFGRRFLAPQLMRWISPDPLAVHSLGADLNVYAYVHGAVFTAIDPVGLAPVDAGVPPMMGTPTEGNTGQTANASLPAATQNSDPQTATAQGADPCPAAPKLSQFGPKIELVTRSYAPFASFGGGFEGDARGPSTSAWATARITSTATIDTATNNVTFHAFSNASAWPANGTRTLAQNSYSYSYPSLPGLLSRMQITATATPTMNGSLTRDGCRGLTINMSHAAGVPLIPGSPDIDLHTTFKLDVVGNDLRVQTSMRGDAFPNAEAFVRFGNDRTFMLHHFETSQGPFGPYYMLPGDFKRDMGSSTTSIPSMASH
jgi:hypothetical protein